MKKGFYIFIIGFAFILIIFLIVFTQMQNGVEENIESESDTSFESIDPMEYKGYDDMHTSDKDDDNNYLNGEKPLSTFSNIELLNNDTLTLAAREKFELEFDVWLKDVCGLEEPTNAEIIENTFSDDINSPSFLIKLDAYGKTVKATYNLVTLHYMFSWYSISH